MNSGQLTDFDPVKNENLDILYFGHITEQKDTTGKVWSKITTNHKRRFHSRCFENNGILSLNSFQKQNNNHSTVLGHS